MLLPFFVCAQGSIIVRFLYLVGVVLQKHLKVRQFALWSCGLILSTRCKYVIGILGRFLLFVGIFSRDGLLLDQKTHVLLRLFLLILVKLLLHLSAVDAFLVNIRRYLA